MRAMSRIEVRRAVVRARILDDGLPRGRNRITLDGDDAAFEIGVNGIGIAGVDPSVADGDNLAAAREFQPAPHDLTDALVYCDMITGPEGHRVTVERRLNEIRARYGPGNVVTRALARSDPELTSAVSRVTYKLARTAPSADPDGPAMVLAAN